MDGCKHGFWKSLALWLLLYTWVGYEEITNGKMPANIHCTAADICDLLPHTNLNLLGRDQPGWVFHSIISPRTQANTSTLGVRWPFIYGKHLVARNVVSQQWIVQMPDSCFPGDHTSCICWIMNLGWITMASLTRRRRLALKQILGIYLSCPI